MKDGVLLSMFKAISKHTENEARKYIICIGLSTVLVFDLDTFVKLINLLPQVKIKLLLITDTIFRKLEESKFTHMPVNGGGS